MKITGSSKGLALASISYLDLVCDFDPYFFVSSSCDKEGFVGLGSYEPCDIEKGGICR